MSFDAADVGKQPVFIPAIHQKIHCHSAHFPGGKCKAVTGNCFITPAEKIYRADLPETDDR